MMEKQIPMQVPLLLRNIKGQLKKMDHLQQGTIKFIIGI